MLMLNGTILILRTRRNSLVTEIEHMIGLLATGNQMNWIVSQFMPAELSQVLWIHAQDTTYQVFIDLGEERILSHEEQEALEEILFHYSGGETIPVKEYLPREEALRWILLVEEAFKKWSK